MRDGLFVVHQMLAMALAAPEVQLSPEEAGALATATANVGRYYVKIPGGNLFSAWVALLITLAMIYLPRAIAIRRRAASPGTNGTAPRDAPAATPETAAGAMFVMPSA